MRSYNLKFDKSCAHFSDLTKFSMKMTEISLSFFQFEERVMYKGNTLKSVLSGAVILSSFNFASHEVLIRDDGDKCFPRSWKENAENLSSLSVSVTNGVNIFYVAFLKCLRGLSNTGALFNTEKQLLVWNEWTDWCKHNFTVFSILKIFASSLLPHLGSSLQFFF